VTTATGEARPRSGLVDIGGEINACVNEIHGWARTLGDAAAADALRAHAARPAPVTTVVVAGETKRGKSSLLNALLGSPGLSPVDVDVATASWVRFAQGPVAARVVPADGGAPVTIEVDDLGRWVSLPATGDDEALERSLSVHHVEVDLPAPVLGGLVLVDTPGVGGLHAGHGRLTLAALDDATALVFVTDAGAPMSEPELVFLEQAAERVAAVVIVVTKIDDRPGWKRVIEENRANLAARGSRFGRAPMIGVSSVLAEQARRASSDGDHELAADLRRASGFAELEGTLMTRIRPAGRALAAANTLQLARSIGSRLERRLSDAAVAAGGDPEATTALEAEQRRLADLQGARAEWGTRLDRLLNVDARADVRNLVRSRTQELRETWEARCLAAGRGDRERLIVELDADLDALWSSATATARELVAGAARQIVEGILADDEVAGLAEVGGGARGPLGEFRSAQSGAVDALATAGGAMGGYMLVARGIDVALLLFGGPVGGAAALTGMAGTALGAVPVAGAGAWAFLSRSVRGTHSQRVELRSWGAREIDRVGADLHAELERSLGRCRVEISDAVRNRLVIRESEVAAALASARSAAARSTAERDALRREVATRLARLRQDLSAVDDLLVRVLRAARLTARPREDGR
jgi:hypothetical protein